MTVGELIAILQLRDQTAEVVLADVTDARCVRELQTYEIRDLTLFRPHMDRAPIQAPRGPPVKVVLLGPLSTASESIAAMEKHTPTGTRPQSK